MNKRTFITPAEIFNSVYSGNTLKVFKTESDILNTVYDKENDRLRVSVDGLDDEIQDRINESLITTITYFPTTGNTLVVNPIQDESIITQSISTGSEVLIGEYISVNPISSNMPAGEWYISTYAKTSSTLLGSSRIKGYIYISGDTSEELIGSFTTENLTTSTKLHYNEVQCSSYNLQGNDHVVVRYYGISTTVSKTISLYVGGIDNATKLKTPLISPNGASLTTYWGDILGTITNQTDLVNYIDNQTSGTTGVDWTTYNTYTGTTAPSLYTTETWVSGFTYDKNYIDNLEVDLSGYTLQSDFETYTGTTAPSLYTTQSWVSGFTYDKNYIDSIEPDLSNYYTKSEVYNTGQTYTQTEINNLIPDLSGYTLESDFETYTGTTAPSLYTTQSWVSGFTYDKNYIDNLEVDLSGYTTKTEFETYTGTTASSLYVNKSNTGTTSSHLGTLDFKSDLFDYWNMKTVNGVNDNRSEIIVQDNRLQLIQNADGNEYNMVELYSNCVTLNTIDIIGNNNLFKIYGTYSDSTRPIKYFTDLSGSYDDRTLVDKGYVDGLIPDTSGFTLQSDFETYTGITAPNTFTTETWVSGFTYDKNYIDNLSGGSGEWGSITGTLSAQTDLQNELNDKVNLTYDYGTGEFTYTEGSTYTIKNSNTSGSEYSRLQISKDLLFLGSTDTTNGVGYSTLYTIAGVSTTPDSNYIAFGISEGGLNKESILYRDRLEMDDTIIKYSKDESSNYDDNTLVQKSYVDDLLDNKLDSTSFETFTGTTLPNNYYNETEVDNLLNNKVNTSDYQTYTGTTAPNTFTTETWVSGFTYDKNYIDNLSGGGGDFDLTGFTYTIPTSETVKYLDSTYTGTNNNSYIDMGNGYVRLVTTNGVAINYFRVNQSFCITGKPINYEVADMSSQYSDSSLVNKYYVDNNSGGVSPEIQYDSYLQSQTPIVQSMIKLGSWYYMNNMRDVNNNQSWSFSSFYYTEIMFVGSRVYFLRHYNQPQHSGQNESYVSYMDLSSSNPSIIDLSSYQPRYVIFNHRDKLISWTYSGTHYIYDCVGQAQLKSTSSGDIIIPYDKDYYILYNDSSYSNTFSKWDYSTDTYKSESREVSSYFGLNSVYYYTYNPWDGNIYTNNNNYFVNVDNGSSVYYSTRFDNLNSFSEMVCNENYTVVNSSGTISVLDNKTNTIATTMNSSNGYIKSINNIIYIEDQSGYSTVLK